MRHPARALVAVACLLTACWPAAEAALDRSDALTVVDDSTVQLLVVETYVGAQARELRSAADADGSGAVNATEAAAYALNETQRRQGNESQYLRWDGAGAVWKNVTAAVERMEGSVTSGSSLSLSVDGVLAVVSAASANHTLTVTRPPGFTSWNMTLVVPADWSFGNVSGASGVSQNGSSLAASVDEGVAVFALAAPSPPASPPPLSVLPTNFLAVLAIAALAAIAAPVGILEWRRRRRRAALESGAPGPPKYVLEGFLLLYQDGRLLFHREAAGSGRLAEPEILGSMFAAVSDFIRDSLRDDSPHSRLTHGNNTILLERTAHLFGAAVIYGEPDAHLREETDEALHRIEAAYTGVVENWSGDRRAFEGAGPMMDALFALTRGVTREQVRAGALEKTVKLLSETEHYRGYIRLKVAVANDTPVAIRDAEVSVRFNEDVLRLARVDPATFARRGATVKVGEVKPGERVSVSYLLDPQTCSETNIEGNLSFRDAAGVAQSSQMKMRHAEIVCPLFFTPEQANAATLERKMEASLPVRDARSFRVSSLPVGKTFPEVFAAARDSVQRHDVKLVRSAATPSPYEGRAWFFGLTKVDRREVVVKVSALEQTGEVEFFVATDAPASLTGLLAELNRSFKEIMGSRMVGAVVEPLLEDPQGTLPPA